MRKAFTLIELLVVIAIIAILAAILFPVFAKAKEAAKKTQDLNNHKQTALGIFTYTTDSDDVFPSAYFHRAWNAPLGGTRAGYVHWSGMTLPYTKNFDILLSPGDKIQGHAPTCFSSADNNSGKGAPPGQRPNLCAAGDNRVPPEFVRGGFIVDNQAPRLSYTANSAVMPRLRNSADQTDGGIKVISQSALDNVGATIMLAGLQDNNQCVSGASLGTPVTQRSHRSVNAATRDRNNEQPYFGENTDGRSTPLYALNFQRIRPQFDLCRTNPQDNRYPLITYHSWSRWEEGDNYGMADGSAKYRKFSATIAVNNYLWGARMYTAQNQALLDPITGNAVQQ
ncbi:MAG: prepilin-type N-terminal cleavage/methylation domain-containing protein [Fimbriimonadaceae bacterium]|nr:prepilin-type N-terminal cleavage/methylation domain-containing protein [Fimbriimonadaceae bacterium]QYK58540.1 MAG: prepilin-type N-terminal cleavage/methylation domain-containing protein [Fimbriimonadaceae bacterium]